MRWRKVTLVGVGLLGGSLGLALKKRALAQRITGYVRRAASIEECIRAGAVDDASLDLLRAVQGADLIVFCTPLAQMKPLADTMRPALAPGAIVTDVGSVKSPVVAELEPLISSAGAHFVGSHPMAGSEKTGVSAARADLFERAVSVVTPSSRSPLPAVETVAALWESVGARVLRMDPDIHDRLVSRSSHLPHALAAHLARYVLDPRQPGEQQELCASGFRDTTRIASGSPEMWRDILLANRAEVGRALDDFMGSLAQFRALLAQGDADAIEFFLNEAKSLRDGWTARCASTSPE